MKKLCAIFLAALMLLSLIPMAAFAKVADDDQIVTEILNGSYQHMSYTHENNYFYDALVAYAVLHADDWGDQIEGNTYEAKAAKDALLSLIDRIEAELNNETYEKILSVLEGASTAAGLLEKVDSFTDVLQLAENSTWSSSLSTLNNLIKIGRLANDQYENYMKGYAIILSCQAANVYYGDLLDYIAAHVADGNIAAAATELKNKITMKLDDANEALIQEMINDIGKEGVLIGIDAAMNTNTVTAAIKTAYNVIGTIGDKFFNFTDIATYASYLAALTRMEDVLPAYVTTQLDKEDDEYAGDFALVSLLTLRETGEKMLSNLGKATSDSLYGKYFSKSDKATELAKAGEVNALKLKVYKDIILDEGTYTTVDVIVNHEAKKNATIVDAAGNAVAVLKNGKESGTITDNGAFYCIYSETLNVYAKVVVTFGQGYEMRLSTSGSSSNNSGGSSGSSSSGGGFFAQLFAAIAAFFKNLFSFGK